MNNLKELRLATGLSQRQLAERANLSLSTIAKLESGERDIMQASMVTISLLCLALKCTVDDLIQNN